MNWKWAVVILFVILLALFSTLFLEGQTPRQLEEIAAQTLKAVGGAEPPRSRLTAMLPILGRNEPSAQNPPADEVIAKYLEELGGIKRLRAWKGMKGKGKFIFPEPNAAEIPLTFWFKPPNKQRMEMTIQGQKAIYATGGAVPWYCDPTRGAVTPTPLPEDQASEARKNDDEYPFIDYKEKGHRVESLGREAFEGREVDIIRLVRKNGSESTHFFDAETGRELRYITTITRGGSEVVQEAIERDFRRTEWLLMPFEIEIKMNGRTVRKMVMDAIEVDPDLDDALFELPKAPEPEDRELAAMKKLDFVIGEWKGEGWLLAGPDQRYPFSVTESYAFRCGGRVLDGEGRFRAPGVEEGAETGTMFGLGMIYYDLPSGEYRIWHYGGTRHGFVFTNRIGVDAEHRSLHYVNQDAKGETYKFGFTVGDDGILTARSERQKSDGTWYVSMEFQMRKVK